MSRRENGWLKKATWRSISLHVVNKISELDNFYRPPCKEAFFWTRRCQELKIVSSRKIWTRCFFSRWCKLKPLSQYLVRLFDISLTFSFFSTLSYHNTSFWALNLRETKDPPGFNFIEPMLGKFLSSMVDFRRSLMLAEFELGLHPVCCFEPTALTAWHKDYVG